jgi:polyisoprenoid-binding protein YceI
MHGLNQQFRVSRWVGTVAIAGLTLAVGCENPAEDKPVATVGEATGGGTREMVIAPKETSEGESATPAVPTPTAEALTFSSASSRVDFTGSKVTGSHEGGFKSVKGTVELADGKMEIARVSAELDMTSSWSDNEGLTKHLKSPDFFDVEKFPKAVFVSTDIKSGGENGATHTIIGDFTLHGVTKSIGFPASVTVAEGKATIKSEFVIKRKDFGIVMDGKPDDAIRDEVVIKLDINATKS